MGAVKAATAETSTSSKKKRPPALTIERREQDMIALAMDEAEYRIRNHTASSAEICHFLKLGTTLAQLEKTKLEKENELLTAKAEAIKSGQQSEQVYLQALNAMRRYSGNGGTTDEVPSEDIF